MFRGIYKLKDYSEEECGRLYAAEVEKICKKIESENKKLGCMIAESIQSCGG